MRDLVAINGEVFKPEDARISVFDRGFLYGDGVYEVVRSYGRVLFAVEEHMDRLLHSAEQIGMDLKMRRSQLVDEYYRIYGFSEIENAYIRLVVTRGEGKITLDPSAATKLNFVFIVKEIDGIDPELYTKGVDIVVAVTQRNPKRSLDPNIKSGNYLNNILAVAEAKKKRAFDAVMVNREGYITEGTTWNVWMVKNGILTTPPDEADILQGITRKVIKKICHHEKLKLEERFFKADELCGADEVFASGSVRELIPVRSVDGIKIGKGVPGPMTLKLSGLYKKYVEEYCKTHGPKLK